MFVTRLVYWLNLANDIEYDTLTPVSRRPGAAPAARDMTAPRDRSMRYFSDPFGAVRGLK